MHELDFRGTCSVKDTKSRFLIYLLTKSSKSLVRLALVFRKIIRKHVRMLMRILVTLFCLEALVSCPAKLACCHLH